MNITRIDTEDGHVVFRSACGEIMDVFYNTFKLREGSIDLYTGNYLSCTLFGLNYQIFKNKVHP